MPTAAYSSGSSPTPTPSCTRPPDSTSSVATDLASTAGWCSGTITTLVPSWMVDVCDATKASQINGSGMPPRFHRRSIFPSSEPLYGVAPSPTATTTCSGHHSDSNPAASAACAIAIARSGSGKVVLAKTMPHFMVAHGSPPDVSPVDLTTSSTLGLWSLSGESEQCLPSHP